MKRLIVIVSALLFIVCGGQKPAQTEAPSTVSDTVSLKTAETAKPESTGSAVAPEPTPATPAENVSPEKVAGKSEKPAELPKLWDFFATWCPPCKKQAPIVEEIAREFEGVVEVRSIDTDKEQELARKFNIQAIPTLVFLDPSGKELSRNVGLMSKDSIIARFKTHGFIK
ncbi:thioredoxin fold domain-containing protein [candidate division WOR-3 bacterium]|nr:thioredoxin fold domain-containing protein [candidate division WOR-3 bacterium]